MRRMIFCIFAAFLGVMLWHVFDEFGFSLMFSGSLTMAFLFRMHKQLSA